MNLLLHGVGPLKAEDGKPPITIGDSLASRGTTRYDVVLTNPPFGKKSSVLVVNEEGEQDREESIATTSNKQLNFDQHVKSVQKVHGRAAVVVPDNVLFEGGGARRSGGTCCRSAMCIRCCGCRRASSTHWG
jgi:type I restriction enzyme M protein